MNNKKRNRDDNENQSESKIYKLETVPDVFEIDVLSSTIESIILEDEDAKQDDSYINKPEHKGYPYESLSSSSAIRSSSAAKSSQNESYFNKPEHKGYQYESSHPVKPSNLVNEDTFDNDYLSSTDEEDNELDKIDDEDSEDDDEETKNLPKDVKL